MRPVGSVRLGGGDGLAQRNGANVDFKSEDKGSNKLCWFI